MSWETWVLAFALVCIIEGLIPFTAPEKWLDASGWRRCDLAYYRLVF